MFASFPSKNPIEMTENITKINSYGLSKIIIQVRNYYYFLEERDRVSGIN